MDARGIKQQLGELCLTPNKALGQNFLADGDAARRIAEDICAPGLPVLEIGPGLGALTGELLARAPRVLAVELDAAMVKALHQHFANAETLTLVHQDFIKFDLTAYAAAQDAYCAVGNLPYYITTPICMKLLSCSTLPRRMTLMVQKEAAARFLEKPGSKLYGPLAVLAQRLYDCSVMMTLTAAQYYPQPEVESVVLSLARKDDTQADPVLVHLLEAAFSMRRKTLMNNLRAAGMEREMLLGIFERHGIDENARAEQLSPDVFADFAKTMAKFTDLFGKK